MKLIRTEIKIKPDRKRVLLRPFEITKERTFKIIKRISNLSDKKIKKELRDVIRRYTKRHRGLRKYFLLRYEYVKKLLQFDQKISEEGKLLIGAYFTNEYSPESAALFNPSIVWSPDQSGLPKGKKRFILSLRATGEGHISSIVFVSGIIDKNNFIKLNKRSRLVTNPEITDNPPGDSIIYEIVYSGGIPLSERIIFPHSTSEKKGIEDARFVEFFDDVGHRTYYATYTAYDGKNIHQQILETRDFFHFKINSLIGSEVKNKGMALFPRKINGQYAMIARQDNENIYLMYSDQLYSWNNKELIVEPEYSWEFVQLGNCGSPIETEEGWLVVSHSVGAVREYMIGAFLLDKNDPSKLIGRLNKPLLIPNEKEREGYVPNVVYSCGGIVNNGKLIIPYAVSDYSSSFAKVNLNALLKKLKSNT